MSAVLKKFISILLFFNFQFSIFNFISAQEVLTGLSSAAMPSHPKALDTLQLQLPFFDDFSNYQGYPDPARWLSNQVFVGQGFAREAPTVGMVTLDALDANGDLYPQASTNLFTADTLASQPIRLDSLKGSMNRPLQLSDSIVLSFFYLPGGWYGNPLDRVGNTPSTQDSLFLDFYSGRDSCWHVVWSTPGCEADTVGVHSKWPWRFASVKVDDIRFLTAHFQFRFRNYASLDDNPKSGIAGNCDQWNIDYIYLNYGRNSSDSTFRDVAFSDPAPTMLQHYQAMPARQFTASDMATSLDMRIVNRYNQTLAADYSYHVFDDNGTQVGSYSGGLENIPAFFPDGRYQTLPVHSNPPVSFTFPVSSQQVSFEVVHVIREGVGGDSRQANDTVRFKQVFADYYAYDDGTPENGYGITKSGPTSSKMYIACRYQLNRLDTLTAVDLFFNRTRGGENENVPFVLCVWSCHNGIPSTIIHRDENRYIPSFDGLNRYHRYKLHTPVVVSDTIFVGFEQQTTDFINMGFDRNTDCRRETYYRVSNEWSQSIWTGSIMMRPCFGESALVNIGDVQAPTLSIYPNPAHDIIHVDMEDAEGQHDISIYDMRGRVVRKTPVASTVSVADLPAGLYIIVVTDPSTGQRITKKILVR